MNYSKSKFQLQYSYKPLRTEDNGRSNQKLIIKTAGGTICEDKQSLTHQKHQLSLLDLKRSVNNVHKTFMSFLTQKLPSKETNPFIINS